MKRPRRSVSLGEENRRAKRGFGAIRLWRNRGGGGLNFEYEKSPALGALPACVGSI
jgi:hypothetical protein